MHHLLLDASHRLTVAALFGGDCFKAVPRHGVMYIYILASNSGVLHTGVTNDLPRWVHQHRSGLISGFTRRYRVSKLVWWEEAREPRAAIVRENEIKGWRRSRRVELIESMNPVWQDLAADWFRE